MWCKSNRRIFNEGQSQRERTIAMTGIKLTSRTVLNKVTLCKRFGMTADHITLSAPSICLASVSGSKKKWFTACMLITGHLISVLNADRNPTLA